MGPQSLGKRMWKMATTGDPIQCADAPVDMDISDPGNTLAIMVAHPTLPCVYFWTDDGATRRYNISAHLDRSADTWDLVDAAGGGRFTPVQNGGASGAVWEVVGELCSTYNVACFAKYNGASSNFYVFKPEAAEGEEEPPTGTLLNESSWLGTMQAQTNPLRIGRW